CILVCTAFEFEQLKTFHHSSILDHVDILALHAITPPHQIPYPHLGLITTRRLGIFLTAHYLNLVRFLMIDDNIQQVTLADNTNLKHNNTWDTLYSLLEHQLGREPCVTVLRQHAPTPLPGQMGSKLFMIDLHKIKEKLHAPE